MSESLFSLKGKTAVVTGALGLLGRQHCTALSEAGAFVIVTDLNDSDCKEYASSFKGNALGTGADLTDPESVRSLKNVILSSRDSIDILINNAALNDKFEDPSSTLDLSKFENYPLALWKKSLDVNLTGTFLCSQILGTEMAKAGKGSIVNIASTYGVTAPDQSLYRDISGNQVFYKSPAYPVTKGGIISFTKFLAAYWGSKGVRVNSLTPGGVENNQDEYFIKQYSARTPLGRMAIPADYKGAIVFLASEASNYMTGANLIIDGGWTVW